MNKKDIIAMVLMTITGSALMMIGLWNVLEGIRWLIAAVIGFVALLYASNEFSKMQFGEIEVEGEED